MPDNPAGGIAGWAQAHPAPALIAVAGLGVLLFVMLPKGGTTVNPPGVPEGIDQNDYATTDELTRLQEWMAAQLQETGTLPDPHTQQDPGRGGAGPGGGSSGGTEPGGSPGGGLGGGEGDGPGKIGPDLRLAPVEDWRAFAGGL